MPQPIIFYDVSDLFAHAKGNATISGIQRMSLCLIGRLLALGWGENIRLIAYHPDRGRFITYDPAIFDFGFEYEQWSFCRAFGLRMTRSTGSKSFSLPDYLLQKYGSGWRSDFHAVRLSALNVITTGRTFNKRKISPRLSSSLCARQLPDEPGPGDVLFVPGATWGLAREHMDFLRRASDCGTKVIQFVHDLIPILMPQYVHDGTTQIFRTWLTEVTDIASGVIVNSENTRRDYVAFSRGSQSIRVVPLAHQFGLLPRRVDDTLASAWEGVSSSVRSATRLPYVLCVGTLEARKNIWTLARAWAGILEKLGPLTPRLVFAGSPGWFNDDFNNFLHGTGNLQGYIRVVEAPSDLELEHLYRHCSFTVYPSYYEGWGLPIGESLWFSKPVIASNAGSMPEVGGALADYVDPYDCKDIMAAALRLIETPGLLAEKKASISAATLRTWDVVADELWTSLTLFHEDSRHFAKFSNLTLDWPRTRIAEIDLVHGAKVGLPSTPG